MKDEALNRAIDFILVDDDDINNVIGRLTIEMVLGEGRVMQSFTRSELALEYLKTFIPRNPPVSTILLLDINMPLMTGWEFIEHFDSLSTQIKDHFHIHILSSSVDERDKEPSYANKNVLSFLVKPLTREVVVEISKGCP